MLYSLLTRLSQVDIDPDIPRTPLSSDSIRNLLQIFFGVMATVAVLIIVIASLNFALSRGNPDKAAKARNTIIYAAIGLALAVAGGALVTFVIGNV